MTLKYFQGFETCLDDTDVKAMGWTGQSSRVPNAFVPSLTQVSGKSMQLLQTSTVDPSAPGASGDAAQYLNTGVTVNQAWQAGGFTVGFHGRFNSAARVRYGSYSIGNPATVIYDGSLYWAIQVTGTSTYNIATSPDLTNWTRTPAQPPVAMDANTTLSYMGNGMVMAFPSTPAGTTTNLVAYFTTNNGASWTSKTIGSVTTGYSGAYPQGVGFATGNSTYPHLIVAAAYNGNLANVNYGNVYVGNLASANAFVAVAPFTGAYTAYPFCRPRIFGNYIVCSATSSFVGNIYSALTSSDISQTSSWTAATSNPSFQILDIAYSATGNNWIFATNGGIYTLPNSGAAGTPIPPTGTFTPTRRVTTPVFSSVVSLPDNSVVALGQNGYIVRSTDGGITWTNTPHLLPLGNSSTGGWAAYTYDGSQYCLFSDSSAGLIATTPDLVNNYNAKYMMDITEVETNTFYGGCGVASGGAMTGTGTFSGNAQIAQLYVRAVSGGTRRIDIGLSSSGSISGVYTADVSSSVFTHHFELVARSATTGNNFFYDFYVDGVMVYQGTTAYPLTASTTDTTSFIYLTSDKRAKMIATDNWTFTIRDGQGLVGPLGPMIAVAERPTTDVQAQWNRVGGQSSNALSVNQQALSARSDIYVQSSNSGDKDIYTSTDALPAGYSAKAVMVEAFFTKQSSSIPSANVGVRSGSTEKTAPDVQMTTSSPTYVSLVLDSDPNGNNAWTNASVAASSITLNHTV